MDTTDPTDAVTEDDAEAPLVKRIMGEVMSYKRALDQQASTDAERADAAEARADAASSRAAAAEASVAELTSKLADARRSGEARVQQLSAQLAAAKSSAEASSAQATHAIAVERAELAEAQRSFLQSLRSYVGDIEGAHVAVMTAARAAVEAATPKGVATPTIDRPTSDVGPPAPGAWPAPVPLHPKPAEPTDDDHLPGAPAARAEGGAHASAGGEVLAPGQLVPDAPPGPERLEAPPATRAAPPPPLAAAVPRPPSAPVPAQWGPPEGSPVIAAPPDGELARDSDAPPVQDPPPPAARGLFRRSPR